MAGGSAGCELRLIRDCGEIERLIATLDSRAEAVEMTGTATRKAEEDCNNLDFFHSLTLLLRSSCIWIGYASGLPRGGQNEAINRVVGVASNWILSWKHWNGECRSLLPIRWLSC